MTIRLFPCLFALLSVLLGAALPARGSWTNPDPPLEEHLRIGLRLRQTVLHDHTRMPDDSYRGSIIHLHVLQNESPLTALTLEWRFNPYVGVQLSWEQVRAETRTMQATETLNHSDGEVSVFGPGLTLILRYPNQTRLTPFAGLGYTWLASNFEHNPAWQNGFGGENRDESYAAWVAAGSPSWPNNGYRRTITLDDATGWMFSYGLDIRITDQLDATLSVQIMDVDGADLTQRLTYYDRVVETRQGTFPMSNTSYGAGLRWTF